MADPKQSGIKVSDVAQVAASMREAAWRQYVEMNIASAAVHGLCGLPESSRWAEDAIARRAVTIAKLATNLICVE